MTMTRTKKRQQGPLDDYVLIGCFLSGVFLVATFFLLLAYSFSDQKAGFHGAVVSVERAVMHIQPKNLRRTTPEPELLETPAVTIDEVMSVFQDFLVELHTRMSAAAKGEQDFLIIHKIYHDLVVEKLYPFDLHYMQHMPKRRSDNSIFLSVASYRDENCLNTLTEAYAHASFPDSLYVGLVQQNCVENCMSGVLKGGGVEPVPPDDDCYQLFCDSPIGKPHCEAHRIRILRVNETESMGPYTARYFASKMWDGESWFMQIDSHMTFAYGWDADSVSMLHKAPSEKPVISHYPPDTQGLNFIVEARRPAARLCEATFSNLDVEHEILRLENTDVWDTARIDIPRFAPFVAAGYFVAHSDFLKDVPFDPFLPWVFMGEEIIMSARLWTYGYDMFSPTHSVVGHIYERRHKPKYWESIGRYLWQGVDSLIEGLVIHRLKHQLGYLESSRDLVWPKSVLFGLEHYTMGNVRSIVDYMKLIGIDPVRKEGVARRWCKAGEPPEYAKDKAHLYK